MNLLNCYKSQISIHNCFEKIKGLNSYRGLIPQVKFAEAYTVLDVGNFKKICKMYSM